MIAALWFIAGLAVGIVATVAAGIVVISVPPAKRERQPISYGAIGAGRVHTNGAQSLYDQLQSRLK